MTKSSSPPDWDALLTQTSWIRGLASSLVADPSTVDDIVQQTWLTAAEKPPKHGRNLRSWFGSVVRSRASKHWRSEQAVLRKHDALKVEEVEADEAIVERMETVRLLAEGVASLKEPYATAVYLRFYEGLTMREIAERQGIPLNTAQTHISRGLILLRQKLASKVGQQWRNRCLVFTAPLPAASSLLTGTTIAIAMTLKTKLALGAALILLASLVVVEPWNAEAEVPQVEGALASADAQRFIESRFADNENNVEREKLIGLDDIAATGSAAVKSEKELLVTVLDGATLQPQAEVEVFVFDYATDPEERRRNEEYRLADKETLLEEFGVQFHADELGQLHFPLPESQVAVMARDGDHFGYGFTVNRDDSSPLELEIVLMPVIKIRTRVLDQNGSPMAGIPVGYTNLPAARAGFPGQTVLTDLDGRAVFEHAEIELHGRHRIPGNIVAVGVPSPTPLFVEFEDDAVPTEEIVFILPALGDLLVHCVYADGEPLMDGFPIELQAGPRDDEFDRKEALGRRTTYVRDGMASFPSVGVGVELLLFGYSDAAGGRFQMSHAGISNPGESLEIEMVWPNDMEPLLVQLVDGEGSPQKMRWVDLRTHFISHDQKSMSIGGSTYVSDTGIVEVKLGFARTKEATKVFLLFRDREMQKDGTSRFSVLPYDSEGSEHASDLGEIESPILLAHGAETLVGGQCVDGDGTGIGGIEFSLYISPIENLEIKHRITAVTAADGSFEFLGELDSELYQAELYAGYEGGNLLFERTQPQVIPFVVGQTDLVVERTRQLDLEGRILVDDVIYRERIMIYAVPSNPAEDLGKTIGGVPDQVGGRFFLEGANPSSPMLVAKDRASGEPLAEWRNLPLDLRDEHGVVQLPDWDLRGLLHRHVIKVTGFDGKAISNPDLSFRTSDGSQQYISSGDGTSFLSTEPILDVWVSASGYKCKTVPSTGETSVTLEKGIQIKISLPEEIHLAEDRVWKAELHRVREDGALRGGGPNTLIFEQVGVDYTFEINQSGVWLLSFSGEPKNADWETMVAWWREPNHEYAFGDNGGAWALELDEQSDGQSFVLPITQEGIEATL